MCVSLMPLCMTLNIPVLYFPVSPSCLQDHPKGSRRYKRELYLFSFCHLEGGGGAWVSSQCGVCGGVSYSHLGHTPLAPAVVTC